MAHDDPRPRALDSGPFWFAVASAASLLAAWVGRLAGLQSLRPGSHLALLVLAWLGALVVAGLATWRLIRRRDYPWLLPLAAVSLLLLRPGRVEVATWRLEWGVFGLAWTLIAVVFFLRLLRKSDELERRIHFEGAAIGIAIAVPAATLYALFEQLLPPLRGQWVAVALLLAWWSGWMVSAIRYR
jgi:hypothetical protein